MLAALLTPFLGLDECLLALPAASAGASVPWRLPLTSAFTRFYCFELRACFAAGLLNLLNNAYFHPLLFVWVQLYLVVLLSSPVVKDVLGAADLVGVVIGSCSGVPTRRFRARMLRWLGPSGMLRLSTQPWRICRLRHPGVSDASILKGMSGTLHGHAGGAGLWLHAHH